MSSSPEVADGEGVTWQWLVGVTMATGQVVAIKKEKEGGWCGLRCDVVTYPTVDGNNSMHLPSGQCGTSEGDR